MLILTRRAGQSILMGLDNKKSFTQSVTVTEISHKSVRVRVWGEGPSYQCWLKKNGVLQICGGEISLESIGLNCCWLAMDHGREVTILRSEIYIRQGGFGGDR